MDNDTNRYPQDNINSQPPQTSSTNSRPYQGSLQPNTSPSFDGHKRRLVWEIVSICLMILVVLISGLAIWSYLNYKSSKEDIDGQIASAVAAAKKEQSDEDEAKFAEREKSPYYSFVGIEDYGRVTFNYPKTWSQYIAREGGSDQTYEAYFNPRFIMALNSKNQYALRVIIKQEDYDKAVASFMPMVKNGSLSSSSVTINNTTATRFDGSFSKDAKGSLVLVKIRDKTLTVRTDSEVFRPDFDKLISTIKFNQ